MMFTRHRWLVRFAAAIAVLLLFPLAARAQQQRQLWVTNSLGNDVHVYDLSTLELVRRLELGEEPHGISATADGRTVHIALEKFKQPQGELLWVDARSGQVTHRLTVGKLPNECECTPDGRWIYVPCDDGHYWVVDGQTHEVATKIRTGGRPHNTVISPDGKTMYLSPMGDPKRVTVVDVAGGHRVLGEIPFADVCRPAAISGDGRRLFQNVDNLLGFQVADTAARRVIATVRDEVSADQAGVASRSHGLAVRPDQREVWSCDVEHFLIHVHEATSGRYAQTATIKLPSRVYWISFTPDSRWALASVRSKNQIAVIDAQSKQVRALLGVGKEPKRTQVIDVAP